MRSAVEAIAVLHSHGVVHADISPRNFLVSEDLSIKLCDFSGSSIDGITSLSQEDRYQAARWTPRTFQTDRFALGCLIYEITTRRRPYDDVPDDDDVQRRYAAKILPCLRGFKYRDIISSCWSSRYASIDHLRSDFDRRFRRAFQFGIRSKSMSQTFPESATMATALIAIGRWLCGFLASL